MAAEGLERSCARRGRIESRAVAPGVEQATARFYAERFSRHRHDVYAMGVTALGTQLFDYRGETRAARPGEAFVLHPDEPHDGRPGDEGGYGYRIAYVAPERIAAARGRPGLPFLATPVSRDGPLRAALIDLIDAEGDLALAGALAALADALDRLAGVRPRAAAGSDAAALARVRDDLAEAAAAGEARSAAELERAHGIERHELARRFRAAYGASPHRFLAFRRLDRARALMAGGAALAEAAAAAGFADQSHMTRAFRATYGLSPGAWRRLGAGA